jgi:large subunit ribosomal protein L35
MPKMKSHTGMGKRVRVTGRGKILAEQAGKRHRLEGKPSTRTRRLSGTVQVAKADVKRIKKLLGR